MPVQLFTAQYEVEVDGKGGMITQQFLDKLPEIPKAWMDVNKLLLGAFSLGILRSELHFLEVLEKAQQSAPTLKRSQCNTGLEPESDGSDEEATEGVSVGVEEAVQSKKLQTENPRKNKTASIEPGHLFKLMKNCQSRFTEAQQTSFSNDTAKLLVYDLLQLCIEMLAPEKFVRYISTTTLPNQQLYLKANALYRGDPSKPVSVSIEGVPDGGLKKVERCSGGDGGGPCVLIVPQTFNKYL